jgi:hypothetical protein
VGSLEAYKEDMARKKTSEEFERWLDAGSPGVGIFKSPGRPDYIPQARYEAARNERVASVQFEARRSVISNGAAVLLALLLFPIHWRLARKLPIPITR